MLSLLAQGNNGTEILSILDTLVTDTIAAADDNEGTLNVIDFWCRRRSVSDTNCVPSGWHWGALMLDLVISVKRQWLPVVSYSVAGA